MRLSPSDSRANSFHFDAARAIAMFICLSRIGSDTRAAPSRSNHEPTLLAKPPVGVMRAKT